MTPVIRIDDEVRNKLIERAIEYSMVFSTPNDVLKVILGLTRMSDNQSKSSESSLPVKNIALKFPKSQDPKVQKLIDGLLPTLSHLSNDGLKYYEKSDRWVAYPNNFVAIKVQDARARNLVITVRGNLNKFDEFRHDLDIKPDRPSYSRFRVDREDQLAVAIRAIKRAYEL